MGLIDDIGAGPLGLDTAPFIYFIETNPDYLSLVQDVFARIDGGHVRAVTSAVTLLEVLVVPYRSGDLPLADRYEVLLTRSRGLTMRELDRPLLKAAARLRASTGMKTPDALQVAAALGGECPVFLTNDRQIPTLPGLTVLQLDRYLPGRP